MTLARAGRAPARRRPHRRRRRSPITAVTHDSRKAGPGALFVAIRGLATDGNQFVEAARKKGAAAIASEQPAAAGRRPGCRCRTRARPWPCSPPPCSASPRSALELVGVTGTNGKTTTTYLIDAALRAAGHKVGPARHRAVPHRRPAGRGRAHDARGLRPAGALPGDGGRGLHARRARGLLALPRAQARARLRVPGGRLHEPHPRPPRLPRRHGRATSQAKRRLFDDAACGRTDAPSSTPTTTARPSCAAASRGAGLDLRHRPSRPTSGPRTSRSALDGTRFRVQTPAGRRSRCETPLLGRFNVAEPAGRLRGRAGAWASTPDGRAARAWPP